MTDTIQVRLAAAACDRCPVAALSERTPLREVRVDPVDERVDFVADEVPTDTPSDVELLEFAGEIHGRYDLDREVCDHGPRDRDHGPHGRDPADPDATASPPDDACGSCACAGFSPAFSGFPVSPRETRIDDGELIATFVLTGYGELRAIVDAFGAAEVRRILVDRDPDDGDGGARSDVTPVDLSDVTERQATVAAVAVEKGYFDPDGATADEIAADLDLAKSTVSEHLRLVTATVLSQLFGGDA
ncbi:helix-turn-helix domain-containing protein [Halorubrum amylolyticum]|uniref:helix-turn-helix domain-containing protein n=1 Tax=Halorubrum amylolyticum TaxID=2508724 RepID=UPI001008BC4E|nr:helix-turn-helix domain-containing protein [Halorubrum amylolyticum]